MLVFTIHAPRASAAPVHLLRKLTQERKLSQVSFSPTSCRVQTADTSCDSVYPTPACCNADGCTGREDALAGTCDALTTFVACCPPVPSG
jgi:hypothetical protein